MKKATLYLALVFCLSRVQAIAQVDDLYLGIQVNTLASSYTVTAANDTTFERELVISIIDTINFKSLNATLSLKTDSVAWQVVQTKTLTEPNNTYIPCSQLLCWYKRQPNVWVIVLGNHSLFTRHRIQLHFNVQNGTGINCDWTDEF